MTPQQKSKTQANEIYYRFCELVKHGQHKGFWKDMPDDIKNGVRFAIGKYMRQHICTTGIGFLDYVQCLSDCIAGGRLKAARKALYLPKYSRKKAMKYKIGKGFSDFGVDANGYA